MKVENNGLDRLSPPEPEGAHGAGKAGEPVSGAGCLNGKDKATLSDRARLLGRARTAMAEVPEMREERVEALREKIRNGTYSVPQEEIVKRLAAQMRMV